VSPVDTKFEISHGQGEWWYPKNTYWRLKTQFEDQEKTLGWPTEQPVERFRESP